MKKHLLTTIKISILILLFTQSYNITFAQKKINYNLDGIIGNSNSHYCYRIDGTWNGCIGDFPDCAKVPNDIDLIKAILSIKKDYNQDKIISGQDLEIAVKQTEDLNKEQNSSCKCNFNYF